MKTLITLVVALAAAVLVSTPLAHPTDQVLADEHPTAGAVQEGPTKGEVNCDGTLNSIDAALILQRSAALVAELPCDDRVDVDGDGQGSAIDAALVLQYVAGLIGHPESTVTVDPGVEPATSSIPDPDGGAPRATAAMADDDGNQTDFVSDELMIFVDDQSTLDAFLSRWNGEVIDSVDVDPQLASAASIAGQALQSVHLVRIDTSLAATNRIVEDLQEIDPDVASNLRFSDPEAMRLFAVAASEAASGVSVAFNPVTYGDGFSGGSVIEASSGPTQGGIPYTANAFQWPYMNQGSAQDIGVGAAWQALEIAGRLDNHSDVLVFDGGFTLNPDFPEGTRTLGSVGKQNPVPCSGGNPCPWHGTNVVATGFGVPDNNEGVAGPGGPVTNLTVYGNPALDFWDIVSYITDLPLAFGEYPDIVNISAGFRMPAAACALACQPFHALTLAVKNFGGTLIVASAGNESKDVEKKSCAPPFDWPCWESGHYLPCELAGVLCVGGLDWDSDERADFVDGNGNRSGSNWSSDPDDNNTVDIYGPYVMYTGPTPNNDGSVPANGPAEIGNGTSYASPFVAGVAALIWAADPSLSVHSVESILMSTAHTHSGDPSVTRWVNAFGAVVQALGSQPPSLEILNPSPPFEDLEAPAGFEVVFRARALDVEDGDLPVTWESDMDGGLGSSTYPLALSVDDLSIGSHTITATTTDSDGFSASISFELEITNLVPSMEIVSPDDSVKYVEGEEILFRALSEDDLGVELDDNNVEWFSDIDGSLGGGHEVLSSLTEGLHVITVEGTDNFGQTGTDWIVVLVNEPPPDLPPTVQITFPEHGDFIGPNFENDLVKITLEGSATDPEDGALTGDSLVWSVSTNGGPVQELGTGTSLYVELPNPPGCGNFWSQEITLTATDSSGNVRSDTVTINDGSIIC